MTIKKIYRYKILSGKWNDFVEIQRQADLLYKKHLFYEVEYIRSLDDVNMITEIQTFPHQENALKAESLMNLEPEMKILFQKFKMLLDKDDNQIIEETGTVDLKL
jgi:hypothetical protein